VEYLQFGVVHRAMATREIILSAGALNTPQLLLLSGIGPKSHLTSLNIPVTFDSPLVGENLQDHVGTMVGPFTINQPLSYLPGRNFNLMTAREFIENGTGPYTLSFAHAVGILASNHAEFPDYPDIQIGLSNLGVGPGSPKGIARMYNVRGELLQEFLKELVGKDSFTLFVNYARPRCVFFLISMATDFCYHGDVKI
jgi:choline dehydrogenase-like flavoprotein